VSFDYLANLRKYHWEGCVGSVEFGYQLSICSGAKEIYGKPSSSWPVAGSSGCKLTTSQQSGINTASPNISPYLCCCFIIQNIYKFGFTDVYMWI
jgi:hypothetical protein